jgi:hypothetical protein
VELRTPARYRSPAGQHGPELDLIGNAFVEEMGADRIDMKSPVVRLLEQGVTLTFGWLGVIGPAGAKIRVLWDCLADIGDGNFQSYPLVAGRVTTLTGDLLMGGEFRRKSTCGKVLSTSSLVRGRHELKRCGKQAGYP